MRNARRAGLGCILTSLFVLAAPAHESGATVHDASDNAPLNVTLTSSKQALKGDGNVILEAKLLNIGEEAVSLFGQLLWGYAGGFTLHIADEDGHIVEPAQHDDDMIASSALGNPEYYLLLFPDQFVGVRRKDSAKNLFPKAGSYSLFVEYRSPVPERYARTPRFWGREKGTIRSTTIIIRVRP